MSTAGPLVSAMARNPPPGLFFACLQLTVEWEHRAYKCYYAQLHTRYCACCTREDGHEGELGPEHYQVGRGIRLSLIHISEPTRRTPISYAVFCLKKKKLG